MKDIPTSPRIIEIRHNRRIRRLRFFVFFLVLLIAIIFALSFFSGRKGMMINKIEITGTHIIDQNDIREEIYQNIFGKYIYLFDKANGFIYPHDQIYNNLISKFPRIEKLSVYRDNLKTLHIDITEKVGSYLYCGVNIPENEEELGENCYFINNEGLIFDKAPYFSGNVYLKYYVDLENGHNKPLGLKLFNTEYFYKITRFIEGISSLGFKPIYIVIDKDGTNYLYLDNKNNKNIPKIIFKNDDDFDIIKDNFEIAMKKKEFSNEVNLKYDRLLYIDLRFKNKVLYKFQ